MSSINKLKNLGNLRLAQKSRIYRTLKENIKIAAVDLTLVELLDSLLLPISDSQFDVLCRIVFLPASVALGLLCFGKTIKPDVNSWRDIQPLLVKFCPIDNAWSLRDARFVKDIHNGCRVFPWGGWKHLDSTTQRKEDLILRQPHRVLNLTQTFHPDFGTKIQSWRLKDVDFWFLKSRLLKLLIFKLQGFYWIGYDGWGRDWRTKFEEDLDNELNLLLAQTRFSQVYQDIYVERNVSAVTRNIVARQDFDWDSPSRGEELLICCALGRSRFQKWNASGETGDYGLFSKVRLPPTQSAS